MTEEDIKQAITWYVNDGYDLITIAQHFGISVEELIFQIKEYKDS